MADILTETTEQLHELVVQLKHAGRYDLLVKAIGIPTIERLCIENAKNTLSRIVVKDDWTITPPEYDSILELNPIHKTVYIFFLRHPEGVEFKKLSEHRDELTELYKLILNAEPEDNRHRKRNLNTEQINETIERLVDPLDNAINEKCSRIKAALSAIVDKYQLQYYAITGHKAKQVEGFNHVWYERKKVIAIDRSLVTMPELCAP